jgi:solute:Na+ symporter, SSS family
MTTLDWLVLGLFCAALVGIIIWVVKKKSDTTEDYFLAGRDATWIAIGASIFASNIGSEHLVGLAGAGASSGMAMAHWEIQGYLILLFGWLFVPFYARSGVFTMPEFLERRYNSQSRSFLSIISLVSYVLTKVAVTVYAGGIVFKQVFGIESIMGIDFFWISADRTRITHRRIYCFRRNESRALHIHFADTGTIIRINSRCGNWSDKAWGVGRDDGDSQGDSC